MGLGLLPQAACEAASHYIHEALRRGYRPGRSEVLVLGHFGAAPPEEAVVRYNWSDRLAVEPPAELHPHDAGDGVVFIGIRPNGASRVDVRYESRF